jgi:transcriptional regulator GlxA family with amidase domain
MRAQGTSFRQIVARERLETARKLVLETAEPLAEIAHNCGFNSPQSLSRAFQANFGRSPSAYRKAKIRN